MIYRTYVCGDCDTIFEVHHDSGDEPIPDCPTCSKVLKWTPKSFNTTGVKSKAVDYAQKVMEEDYGLSNFRDNNREGDVGYIDPTRKTAAEADAIGQRESEAGREVVHRLAQISPDHKTQVDNFFGGQSASIGQNKVPVQQLIQAGKTGAGSEVNPMSLLHKAGKEGKLPDKTRIIYKSDLK